MILYIENIEKIFICLVLTLLSQTSLAAKECVIVTHGLARSTLSMTTLIEQLRLADFEVIPHDYSSQSHDLPTLAETLATPIAQCEALSAQPIHFVTHSMGGIVVRQYFQNRNKENASRIVMIAPPNKGSELVDAFQDFWLFHIGAGPSGLQLGTQENSLPKALKPIPLEIGVIAGQYCWIFCFDSIFGTTAHDGRVTVENTKLEEMRDFFVAEHSHTGLLRSDKVAEQTIHFLRHGSFAPLTTSTSANTETNDSKDIANSN